MCPTSDQSFEARTHEIKHLFRPYNKIIKLTIWMNISNQAGPNCVTQKRGYVSQRGSKGKERIN